MLSRIAAFVIWGAVAAGIAYWALQLLAEPLRVPAHATQVAMANSHRGDLARVLGADLPTQVGAAPVAAQPVADPRFRLIGVVAPRNAAADTMGLAVISTDNKPPRAYAVGAAVDGELVLLSVYARGAALGPAGQSAQVSLELPALPPPATGTPGSTANSLPAVRPPPAMAPSRPNPPRPPSRGDGSDEESAPPDGNAPLPPASEGQPALPVVPPGAMGQRPPV